MVYVRAFKNKRLPIFVSRVKLFTSSRGHLHTLRLCVALSAICANFACLAEAQVNEGIARLEWENLPEASGYEVEFSKDKDFKNIIVTKTTKFNATSWDQTQAGTYYWHVRAMDQNGRLGEFSQVASFDVVTPNEEIRPPGLTAPVNSTASPAATPVPQIQIVQEPKLVKPRPIPVSSPPPFLTDSSSGPPPAAPLPDPVAASRQEKKPIIKPRPGHEFGLALSTYALGTLGTMADTIGAFPSRTMLTWTPALSLGYRFNRVTPSLYGEYNFAFQTTSVNNAANQNATGQGFLAGVQLKYEARKFFIAGNFLFSGSYTESQQTPQLQTSIYSNPVGGALFFGWYLSDRMSLLLTGKDISYRNWNLASLSGDTVYQFSYGMGLSYDLW